MNQYMKDDDLTEEQIEEIIAESERFHRSGDKFIAALMAED